MTESHAAAMHSAAQGYRRERLEGKPYITSTLDRPEQVRAAPIAPRPKPAKPDTPRRAPDTDYTMDTTALTSAIVLATMPLLIGDGS